MKYCFILLLSVAFTGLMAQAPSSVSDQPTRLLRANEVIPAAAPAIPAQQAQSWKMQTDQYPANAGAWFNYYLWTSRDQQSGQQEKKEKLAAIITSAGEHIGSSPEYDLMVYLQSGKKDSTSLYRVMASGMDKAVTYPYIIQFFIEKNDAAALERYCRGSEVLTPLPRDLYQYHYNVLMSAGRNATVYAKGVNDLVPLAILQQVYGIRKDLRLATYRQSITSDTTAYLCLSLGKEVLSGYPQAYYTGLLVRLAGSGPVRELEQHIEKDFDLSYLVNRSPLSQDAALLYRNYLPSLILLYNDYTKTGNVKAQDIRAMIETIAGKTGLEINKLTGE